MKPSTTRTLSFAILYLCAGWHLLAASLPASSPVDSARSVPVPLDGELDQNWEIAFTAGGPEATAGFKLDVAGPENNALPVLWEGRSPAQYRLIKWGKGIYFERNGKLENFTWLKDSTLKAVSCQLNGKQDGGAVTTEGPTVQKLSAPPRPEKMNLDRPQSRHLFMTTLNWMNRFSFRRISTTEYDFPIAPLDQGLEWDLRQMATHGIDVVALDNVATKRPRAVVPFYETLSQWHEAMVNFKDAPMYFVPFWEYDTGKGRAGESYTTEDAERYFADITGYFSVRYASDPKFLKLQDRPFHLVYSAMTNNPPSFWAAAVGHLRDAGLAPILSLGIGGIPISVEGKFSGSDVAAYTDSLFDSTFLFNFGPKALHLPKVMMEYLNERTPSCYVIGAAVPGYWSVRHNMKNYEDYRYTRRLCDTLGASLDAKVDGIHLTTWDDWQENTSFAPSFSSLDSRMEITQALTAEWRQAPAAVAAKMPRTIVTYKRAWRKGEPLGVEVMGLPTEGFSSKIRAEIRVLNQNGQPVCSLNTPELEAAKCESFLCNTPATNTKAWNKIAGPSVLSIDMTIYCGGKAFPVRHLPQIAVVPDEYMDSDLLYYSIPVHRLAGAEHNLTLAVNGATTQGTYAGIATYGLRSEKENLDGVHLAMSRNGHPIRHMAPYGTLGAETTLRRDSKFTLSPRNPRESIADSLPPTVVYPEAEGPENPYAGKSTASLSSNGMLHYTGLVQFEDGTYAYTNTVWCIPAISYGKISALWVMAPDENGVLRDMGPLRINLPLNLGGSALKAVQAPGSRPALLCNQSDGIKLPLNVVSSGPATVECVFSFAATGKEMSLFSQSGAQVNLRINAKGSLVCQRLNDQKEVVEVVSEPLQPDTLICATGVYTGSKIQLYVNGKIVGEKPVTGSRTNEGVTLGGTPSALFSGRIYKLGIYSGALDQSTISKNVQDTCNSRP